MADILVGLAFSLVSFVILWQSQSLPSAPVGVFISSATFPRIVALIMLGFAIGLIIRGIRGSASQIKGMPINKRGLVAIVLAVAYLFAFNRLGFILSSFLIVSSYSVLLQKGKPRFFDTLVSPLVTVIIVYFVFYFLRVPLPIGTLFS